MFVVIIVTYSNEVRWWLSKLLGSKKIENKIFFSCLILLLSSFSVSSPLPHFNDAISRRAENYTTCSDTCYYKSNFVPQLLSRIKIALKSFYIIQQNCFAFWFGLHIGKLPSSNAKFAALVKFFTDRMNILPAQMTMPGFVFLPCMW